MKPTFPEAVAALMTLVALGVLSWLALATKLDVTIGAIIAVLASGTQYWTPERIAAMRARQ